MALAELVTVQSDQGPLGTQPRAVVFAQVTSSSSVSLLSPAPPLSLLDTMVCTGCCSCLDHIVTYLFKQLSRSTKKRTTPLNQESDRFLHIMQQHPEMIQQVRNVRVSRQWWYLAGAEPLSFSFPLEEPLFRRGEARQDSGSDSYLTGLMLPRSLSLKWQWIMGGLSNHQIQKLGVSQQPLGFRPGPWTLCSFYDSDFAHP